MLAKKILQITRHGYYEQQVEKIAQLLHSITSASNDAKPIVSGALPDDSELEDWLFDGYERNSKNLERLKIGKVVRDRIAQKLNSGQ